MEIIILSRKEALEFIPKVLTYAIRIRDYNDRSELPPLIASDLFKPIKEYCFDDAEPDSHGVGPLEKGLAEKIIGDFQTFSFNCGCLMVHCNEGRSRSPAVAMALNDIFDLGNDHHALQGYYQDYNPHVFKQLIMTADRINLLSQKVKCGCLEQFFLAS